MCDCRHGTEEFDRFVDLHLKDFADIAVLPGHGERFRIEACAMANFARDLHVGQKSHLDRAQALSCAGFASSTRIVEGEAARTIAACLAFIRACKECPDVVKESDVGGGA